MTYKTSLLSLVVLILVNGCSNRNQNENIDNTALKQKSVVIDSNIVKVYIEENGTITANGNPISLIDLDSSLSKLKISNGMVYYSRANGQGEPPPGYMQVMNLIIKYGLPIKLYTDNTFSEIVKPN